MSFLHNLVKAENDLERTRRLLKAGVNPNIRTSEGTPLVIVASKKVTDPQDIEDVLQVARELISFGADVNLDDDFGSTPLMSAVNAWNYRMVELLLQNNASINQKDKDGSTALHHAIWIRDSTYKGRENVSDLKLRIVKALLRFHPELDIKNRFDRIPLILAIHGTNFRIVQELLKQNVSVTFPDSKNNSPMHHALHKGDVNIVLELVRHGGEFNMRNRFGETPMDVYIRRLSGFTNVEVEKAKFVFKLYLFGGNSFNAPQQMVIERISVERNCQFPQFLEYCKTEIIEMRCDELAPNYYVYDMALRNFSCRVVQNNHVIFDVFDRVLHKLMSGQYPVYCDMIVSGICSPYLNRKFTEICCLVRTTGTDFLTFDELYSLSFYLSHLDMLNMMIACSPDNRCETVPHLEHRHFYTNCTLL